MVGGWRSLSFPEGGLADAATVSPMTLPRLATVPVVAALLLPGCAPKASTMGATSSPADAPRLVALGPADQPFVDLLGERPGGMQSGAVSYLFVAAPRP